MTREEIIHIFENSRLVSEHFDSESVTDAYIEGLAALREQEQRENRKGVDFDAVNNWIPVAERLPERTVPPCDVLVYHDLGCGMFVDRAWYSHEKHRWISVLGSKLKVTHWMPLPEPPKEDDL